MRYKSIQDQGGLKAYLDLPEQINRHNGHGYAMWVEAKRIRLNTTAKAKLFNVTRETISTWQKNDLVESLAKYDEADKHE